MYIIMQYAVLVLVWYCKYLLSLTWWNNLLAPALPCGESNMFSVVAAKSLIWLNIKIEEKYNLDNIIIMSFCTIFLVAVTIWWKLQVSKATSCEVSGSYWCWDHGKWYSPVSGHIRNTMCLGWTKPRGTTISFGFLLVFFKW